MNTTTVMERPQQSSQLVQFRDRLIQRRPELEHALQGSGVSVDRFIRTATTAVQLQPELISDVSFQSLWTELLKACRDGLLPDGRQGVIIAYKRNARWQPMYQGLLDRFQQSGEFKWIYADVHRDDDKVFDAWVDEHGQHFIHRPGPREGAVIETFACATTKSGGFFVTVISEKDMDRIRSVSRAKSDDAPWQTWPDEMRKKSALRRLCKLLPVPQPLEDLVRSDDDDGEPGETATPAPGKPLPRPRGAANTLEQFAGEPERERADAGQSGKYEGGTDNGTK